MDVMDNDLQILKPASLAVGVAALSILYFVGIVIYRLYFHPLSKIPGPWTNAVFRLPFARHMFNGTTAENTIKLHEKYGDAVRLSPDQVSFISADTAWQDIYGFRTGKHRGELTFQKNRNWFPPAAAGGIHIINAEDADHTRFRRVYAHAFSERALGNQEGLIQGYVDLLVQQLKVASVKKPLQDVNEWFQWITFDVIADLTFGESWGCLRDMEEKYIPTINSSVRYFRLHYLIRHYPVLWRLFGWMLTNVTSDLKGRAQFGVWVKETTQKRMEMDTQRADFMTEVLNHNGEKGVKLTTHEIATNNSVMMGAGSETTASLLSGVIWSLLKNPRTMQKLKDEVRGQWKKYDDITLDAVNKSPYLLAVLSEGLRFFPPVATGFERAAPKGGAVVSGYYIPEGTGVGVSSMALGWSDRYFTEAKSFIPERWLDEEPRFANDKRDLLQPFNYGPRNCLGKNLAYAEMRLILAKLIWSFDMELDSSCDDWLNGCKVMAVWYKPPLLVKMIEVERD